MALDYIDIDLTSEANTNARVREFTTKVFKTLWADYDACPDYDGVWRWLASKSGDTSTDTWYGLHVGPGNAYGGNDDTSSTNLYFAMCGVQPAYKAWVNNDRLTWDVNNPSYTTFAISTFCELPYLRAYKLKDNYYMISKFADATDRANNCGQPIMIFGIEVKDEIPTFGFGYMNTTDKGGVYNTFSQPNLVYNTSSSGYTGSYNPNYGILNFPALYELGSQKMIMQKEALTRWDAKGPNILWSGENIVFDNLAFVLTTGVQVARGNKYIINGEQWLCLIGSTTSNNDRLRTGIAPRQPGLLIKS